MRAQSYRWAAKATSSQEDYARGITIDNAGNYYVIGKFSGTINFDSAGFTKSLSSAGQSDIYLAKFNCNRNLVWVNRIGGTSAEAGDFNCLAVKYDNAGNIYVTGAFSGTATLTSTLGSSKTLTSAGSDDIFFAKYKTQGELLWAIRAGGTDRDEGTNIAIDYSGDIILCGFFSATATWGTTSGATLSTTSGGRTDACIAKYNPSGKPIWAKTASSQGEEIVTCLAIDKQNNIYSAGNYACCSGGTATFGTKSITNQPGMWGAFIAKMNANGNWVWVNGMGKTVSEAGSACVVDDSGNVFFSGHFDGNTSISSSLPGSAISLTNNGSYDIFLSKYDTAGVLKWAKRFGGSGSDANRDLLLNTRGNIVITGEFNNTVDFSGTSLTSSGGSDVYIAEYTKSGNLVQCIKGGGPGADMGLCMSQDSRGQIYVAGLYTSSARFGAFTLTGQGAEESFVVKLSSGTSFSLSPQLSALCQGDSVILTTSTPLPSNLTFKWLLNGNILPGATNDTLFAKTEGTYRMIITDQCNESDTSLTAVITIKVIVSNIADKSICFGDSVQLVATGGSSYSWTPTTGLSNPNIANPYAKPTASQQYIVTIVSGSCTVKDTVMVYIRDNIDAGPNQTICLGDSIQLNATGSASYAWNPNPTLSDTSVQNPYVKPINTQTYYVWGAVGGCKTLDSVQISVVSFITVSAGSDTSICAGDSAQLHASGATVYSWGPAISLSNVSSPSPYAKPLSTTMYEVSGTIGSCFDKDSVWVIVKTTPKINLGPDTVKCADQPFTFLPAVSDGDLYNWEPSTEISDPTILNPYSLSDSSQTYILTATNIGTGCSSSEDIFVAVQKPVARFSLSQTTGVTPFTVSPQNTSSPLPLQYNWEIMDTVSFFYTNKEPTHTFAKQGTYTILLTVTDNRGCMDSTSAEITTYINGNIYVPNVFTPNGDGVNDVFDVHYPRETILALHGSIWNRWGKQIYEFSAPDNKWWDGTFDNKDAVSDVYFYIIDAVDFTQQNIRLTGTVTLLR